MVDPLTYSSREAARQLSISERTLYELTMPRGTIPVVKLAGRNVYSRQALVEWIAHQEANPPPPVKRDTSKAVKAALERRRPKPTRKASLKVQQRDERLTSVANR